MYYLNAANARYAHGQSRRKGYKSPQKFAKQKDRKSSQVEGYIWRGERTGLAYEAAVVGPEQKFRKSTKEMKRGASHTKGLQKFSLDPLKSKVLTPATFSAPSGPCIQAFPAPSNWYHCCITTTPRLSPVHLRQWVLLISCASMYRAVGAIEPLCDSHCRFVRRGKAGSQSPTSMIMVRTHSDSVGAESWYSGWWV